MAHELVKPRRTEARGRHWLAHQVIGDLMHPATQNHHAQIAVRPSRAVNDIDISRMLSQVSIPTLVMHCRDNAVQHFQEGRRLAAGIPGARFVVFSDAITLFWNAILHWATSKRKQIRSYLAQ